MNRLFSILTFPLVLMLLSNLAVAAIALNQCIVIKENDTVYANSGIDGLPAPGRSVIIPKYRLTFVWSFLCYQVVFYPL